MAFVTTLHLQASADAALSCKPGRPVTRRGCGHEQSRIMGRASLRLGGGSLSRHKDGKPEPGTANTQTLDS